MSNQLSILITDYDNNTLMSLKEFFADKNGAKDFTFKYGEDSYIIKPQVKEVQDIGKKSAINNTDKKLELIVSENLRSIGVPPHIKGYQYLRKAIIMCVSDITVLDFITKQLYPDIAKMFNTTSDRVERAIRHAIETAWVRGKSSIVEEVFGYSNLNNIRPTNSEFIATVSDKIRLGLNVVY